MEKHDKGFRFGFLSVSICSLLTAAAQADDDVLTSIKTPAPIVIDGKPDPAWQSATPLAIVLDRTLYQPDNGYQGMTRTSVSIKSLYDDKYLYMLLQYADPTYSIDRFPWVKQADGSWKQMSAKDNTRHENTYYEDKLSIIWNINAAQFDKKGCALACHKSSAGKVKGIEDDSPGRKYTAPGETLDMWHWKSVRTNVNHQLDDQFVDSTADPASNKNWGRKTDSQTGGGYKDNRVGDLPAWVAGDLGSTSVAILESEKIPFEPGYAGSNRIPGIVTAPFEGSRGDVEAYGVWHEGVWTIELKRALLTSGPQASVQDVQFSDKTKPWLFGVAVFDNSQINHLFHYDRYQLVFE